MSAVALCVTPTKSAAARLRVVRNVIVLSFMIRPCGFCDAFPARLSLAKLNVLISASNVTILDARHASSGGDERNVCDVSSSSETWPFANISLASSKFSGATQIANGPGQSLAKFTSILGTTTCGIFINVSRRDITVAEDSSYSSPTSNQSPLDI